MDGKLEPAYQWWKGPSFEVMFKVMSLKFHNHEFQGYHSRNKHDHLVKAIQHL